jgi:hypothetical protein
VLLTFRGAFLIAQLGAQRPFVARPQDVRKEQPLQVAQVSRHFAEFPDDRRVAEIPRGRIAGPAEGDHSAVCGAREGCNCALDLTCISHVYRTYYDSEGSGCRLDRSELGNSGRIT